MDQIAIVTGGASGIGFAAAKKIADKGIKTIIIGRNPDKLAKAAEYLGCFCSYMQFDLTQLNGIPGLAEKIVNEYGHIDTLVNNEGINQKSSLPKLAIMILGILFTPIFRRYSR